MTFNRNPSKNRNQVLLHLISHPSNNLHTYQTSFCLLFFHHDYIVTFIHSFQLTMITMREGVTTQNEGLCIGIQLGALHAECAAAAAKFSCQNYSWYTLTNQVVDGFIGTQTKLYIISVSRFWTSQNLFLQSSKLVLQQNPSSFTIYI